MSLGGDRYRKQKLFLRLLRCKASQVIGLAPFRRNPLPRLTRARRHNETASIAPPPDLEAALGATVAIFTLWDTPPTVIVHTSVCPGALGATAVNDNVPPGFTVPCITSGD